MKVSYKAGSTVVEVEGKDSKDCFTQIASAMDVFSHAHCGACGSTEISPVVREYEGNHYYELRCGACRACLSFGQKRVDGSLYPRRKDKSGQWLDNNGWVKWQSKPADSSDEPF